MTETQSSDRPAIRVSMREEDFSHSVTGPTSQCDNCGKEIIVGEESIDLEDFSSPEEGEIDARICQVCGEKVIKNQLEDTLSEHEEAADKFIAAIDDSIPENPEVTQYNPEKSDRLPRNIAETQEVDNLCEILQTERGDQRIGQFIINAVRTRYGLTDKETIENRIWSMETTELLETLEGYSQGDYE